MEAGKNHALSWLWLLGHSGQGFEAPSWPSTDPTKYELSPPAPFTFKTYPALGSSQTEEGQLVVEGKVEGSVVLHETLCADSYGGYSLPQKTSKEKGAAQNLRKPQSSSNLWF